jgi:hypothetical protein
MAVICCPVVLNSAPLKAVMVAQRPLPADPVSLRNCSEAKAPASGIKHSPPTQQLLRSAALRRCPPGLQAGSVTTWFLIICRNRIQLGAKLSRSRICRDSSMAETPWALICPPSHGATSIRQVWAPLAMACPAAAMPPREPPTTTTSHSHTSWALGLGLSCGRPFKKAGSGRRDTRS